MNAIRSLLRSPNWDRAMFIYSHPITASGSYELNHAPKHRMPDQMLQAHHEPAGERHSDHRARSDPVSLNRVLNRLGHNVCLGLALLPTGTRLRAAGRDLGRFSS
jgi:hypothetical protein